MRIKLEFQEQSVPAIKSNRCTFLDSKGLKND